MTLHRVLRSTARALAVGSLVGVAAGGSVAADAPTASASGAPPATLTLEALEVEVLQQNPEIAFYRAEIDAAKAGRQTAAAWKNPELSADLGSKRVWERNGPAIGDGAAWSVAVAQTFEFPGRIALRKAIANQQIVLAQLGLEQFQAALAARARTLGHAALAAQEKVEAVGEVADRFSALSEVLVQRDPAGITPLLDTRIIEANTLTLRRRLSQAERERQSALLELNQLRGQPPATSLRLLGPVLLPTHCPALETLCLMAATNNFDLRLRQAELAQQGFQVQLAHHERWPSVTLAPFYASEKANDEQRIVGVGVSVPLPLWHRNRGNIAAAEARLQQAEASLRLTQRQVEGKVADHALALKTRLDEMSYWRADTAAQFRAAAQLADRHYRLGAVPVTLYVEMQLKYLDALEALLATRQEALDHALQLGLLTGRPLDGTAAR